MLRGIDNDGCFLYGAGERKNEKFNAAVVRLLNKYIDAKIFSIFSITLFIRQCCG